MPQNDACTSRTQQPRGLKMRVLILRELGGRLCQTIWKTAARSGEFKIRSIHLQMLQVHTAQLQQKESSLNTVKVSGRRLHSCIKMDPWRQHWDSREQLQRGVYFVPDNINSGNGRIMKMLLDGEVVVTAKRIGTAIPFSELQGADRPQTRSSGVFYRANTGQTASDDRCRIQGQTNGSQRSNGTSAAKRREEK